MRAIVQDPYGSPANVLELRDVERPEPGEGQVLVRTDAAGVSIGVLHLVRGIPYMVSEVISLAAAGEITPVIEATYPLDQVPQALAHQGDGHVHGQAGD